MKKRIHTDKMLLDTAVLSLFSVGLQGLGLLFNVFLTRRLGAANVGIMTLMSSFYGLAAVLSSGSGFVAVSRFVSEELGCGGDPARIFRYVLRFCMILSCSVCAVLLITAPLLTNRIPDAQCSAIRMLSLSLPLSAAAGCLKGRCYAYQRVYIPAVSEYTEFLIRSGVLAFCIVFLLPDNRMTLLTAFAVSMLAGQGSTVIFLAAARVPRPEAPCICSFTVSRFLRLILPMIGNACLVAVLSSTNDALVPLTLLQYGSSTEEALAQFGEFEAIIIPTLFFPSVVQCCQSALLVPTLSRARAEQRESDIRMQTQRMLEQTVRYALFTVLILSQLGAQIGEMLGGNRFTGQILQQMAPIVPFIYLEIILEGILRGLGRQNFSSVNYLAEYIVRISVLLICVPLFGFYGIVLSYVACNLSGNAVRLYYVLRVTGLKPVWKRILLFPVTALFISLLIPKLASKITSGSGLCAIPAAIVSAGVYWGIVYLLSMPSDSCRKLLIAQRSGISSMVR
ncbi:MAG: polysaccharide biosynthesis C-terminal domain-containing protein [Oscillospiraceae bacterium]|nr:polysaccharide biosynthesis C-terminal domain-containing protein [Oscillospiraceae bacterium]